MSEYVETFEYVTICYKCKKTIVLKVPKVDGTHQLKCPNCGNTIDITVRGGGVVCEIHH